MTASISTATAVTPAASEPLLRSQVIAVYGVVQGVGFRPFVHRVANALGLCGTVRNDGARVCIEATGTSEALEQLAKTLAADAPQLAVVERIVATEVPRSGAESDPRRRGFVVAASTSAAVQAATAFGTAVPLTADAAICTRCEAELMDARNRRYRHAFISCTDCGPRWSMVEAMPYDRVRTTMRAFPMCPVCAREYANPADRRFHAESICCHACGPQLTAYDAEGAQRGRQADAIALAVSALREGMIVALHGIGGFHLAVDATNERAVARLRERKHRPEKPLAVMVRTVYEAAHLVDVDDVTGQMLQRAERPVVVARRRSSAVLATGVAPGLADVGVMLPGTAVQHLLLHDLGVPLVMTSGNASGEPIAATPSDAWRDLAGIADLLLVHDREVVAPSDDTVVRRDGPGFVFMRRARGWSPSRLTLPRATPVPVLAVGADLKATVALADSQYLWLSPHLGDQSSYAVQERTATTIARLVALSGRIPQVVACDVHPGYASVAMLERWRGNGASAPFPGADRLEVHRIQHHHAHVAAVLVEHGVTHPVVALAYDGAGWGLDGTVWGGEVLVADLMRVQRVGALCAVPVVGGDLAARDPWRAAMGWLHDWPGTALASATANVHDELLQASRRLAVHHGTLRTSSMGRLFDAAAAVLQSTARNSYEGEAAARLEALAAAEPARAGTPFAFVTPERADAPWRLDARGALERLAQQRAAGVPATVLAARWHDDIVSTSVAAALRAIDEQRAHLTAAPTVVLCGGVFQNVRLLQGIRAGLRDAGIAVLAARTLPPNDGAIAVGQASIVAATMTMSAPTASTTDTFIDHAGRTI
ncbi:carbamoyltransferase HypF [Gemmatimonas sp.]